jgi:pyrroloquinoline quinone biosynthesis protein D
MSDNELLKPVHAANVAARVYGNDAVIISPDEGVVRMLNPTATRIWQLVDGSRSADDIAAVLTGEYDIDFPHARQSVERLLDEFSEKQLITWVSR